LCLIDSSVSPSEPPCAAEFVVILTLVNPPIFPCNENELAPLAAVLFVTMYCKITILPSSKAAPLIPSPKYTSYLLSSPSCIKYTFELALTLL